LFDALGPATSDVLVVGATKTFNANKTRQKPKAHTGFWFIFTICTFICTLSGPRDLVRDRGGPVSALDLRLLTALVFLFAAVAAFAFFKAM
jgi:hypothetical protein